MEDKYKFITKKDLNQFQNNNILKKNDWYENKIHLSSFSGLVNDPNGLVFFNGAYYIFMQNCPFSPEHKNKSWLLYSTRNFIEYKYEGITITPSCEFDKNGAFSGSAFVENDKLFFYYTGNVKINDNKRTSYTIKAEIDLINKKVYKKVLFEMPKKYSGHFRDPFLFENDGDIYMINGAQTKDLKGVVTLHKRLEKDNWKLVADSDLKLENEFSNYMIECPNLVKFNHKSILFFSLEQNIEFKNGGHRCWYTEFNFNDFKNNTKKSIKVLEDSLDFYAPQLFNNSDRKILLAWLGNSKSLPKITFENMWSSMLTIPREVKYIDNNICMYPIKEIENLRIKQLDSQLEIEYDNGLAEFVATNIQGEFNFKISNENNEYIYFEFIQNKFSFNRINCTYIDKELPDTYSFDIEKITDFRIIIDRSCIEIFLNLGEKSTTVKMFIKNHNKIITNLMGKAYQLKEFKIENNNILFDNELV